MNFIIAPTFVKSRISEKGQGLLEQSQVLIEAQFIASKGEFEQSNLYIILLTQGLPEKEDARHTSG